MLYLYWNRHFKLVFLSPVNFLLVWGFFVLVLIYTEKELLESLPLSKQCMEEQELLHFLFENKLKKVKNKKINKKKGKAKKCLNWKTCPKC